MTAALKNECEDGDYFNIPYESLPTLDFFLDEDVRYKVAYGGRGSGKSWSVARSLVIKAILGKYRILCTREYQSSISDSVYKLLVDQIDMLDLNRYYSITKNSIRSVYGSAFLFKGLHHSITEIKSTEGIDICWVEEAEKVSKESWDTLLPTIRQEGSEIWVTFNPDDIDGATYKRFVVSPPENSIVVKINYDENPFFPDVLKQEKDYLKRVNYEGYRHVWLGEPRIMSDAQVFNGHYAIEDFDTPDNATFYYGADFGFANDPSILVRCFVHDDRLYIDYEAYKVGVTIDDLPDFWMSVPDSHKHIIRADSARPDTIRYMVDHGFPSCVPCEKGPNSIQEGVEYIKSFEKVVIHPRCKNTADEFKFYSYKVDRISGRILPIIIDAHNHIIDALRYSLLDQKEPEYVPQCCKY